MRNKLKGFTIIEVSLVLAIAGLIFLMIFVALPALQRQSRDTARKEDITAFISAVKKYQTNNRGALPTDWSSMIGQYLDDGFEDPDGNSYNLIQVGCAGEVEKQCTNEEVKAAVNGKYPNGYTMYVVVQAKCSGNENTGAERTSNPRKLAVLYRLEGGGLYCENT